LKFYTIVSGCGCGFGFEQKYWQIDGFGEKKARIPIPGSNWNLEYLEKNLSEQSREPTTNSTHIWRQVQE